MHVCSKIEMAVLFHKPAKKDASKIAQLRESNVLYCIDSVDKEGVPVNKAIYGPDDGRDHRRIDLLYLPCDPVTYTPDAILEKDQCFVKNRNDEVEMAAKLKAT